jgi:hypothetical protein
LAAEADLRNMLKEASKHLCTTAAVLLTLSPTPTSSVMKTHPQVPGPSASLVETEETPESKEGTLIPLNQQLKKISK